jgi:predicted 3-demethylubiquinone-9 3-methyltransferase (glyoxalase superfamily)
MQKITTFLWFDHQAEEAANFYTSIFINSKIVQINHYPRAMEEVSGKKAGDVMTVVFELAGQEFVALNGGPEFSFTPAVSLVVYCDSQAEIDTMWEKLSAGGKEIQCGWLADRFGVSWQIVPRNINELFSSSDQEKNERTAQALLTMKKINIDALNMA